MKQPNYKLSENEILFGKYEFERFKYVDPYDGKRLVLICIVNGVKSVSNPCSQGYHEAWEKKKLIKQMDKVDFVKFKRLKDQSPSYKDCLK